MKVSVITTTYNHPEWMLKKAIESVTSQEFVDIMHIVIDDTHNHNGMIRTFGDAFKRCTGEYIAFCDGDDYWIDDCKLFKQLVYMNNHMDCGLCIANVYTLVGDEYIPCPKSSKFINKNMSFDSLLMGNAYIYAQSYLIRKSDFDKYIDFEKFIRLGFVVWDLPIVLELIRHTRFHHLDFYAAVFRKGEESATQTRSRIKRFRYIMGIYKIKIYYILKYGCKPYTALYLTYRFIRHIYSITFKRWT